MNIMKCFECDSCNTRLDIRVGLSNRDFQPFQFACPVCEQRITFNILDDDLNLQGASNIIDFKGPFTGENPFIDLHLDFPASFEPYEQGKTAFMRAIANIGEVAYFMLKEKLDMLNILYSKNRELQQLITQYNRDDFKTFKKSCKRLLNIPVTSSKRQDIIRALYTATSIMSSPFTIHEHNEELSEEMPHIFYIIYQNHKDKLLEFIDRLLSTGFLKNLHSDCLSLYPKIISLDLPLRPTLYFDYAKTDETSKISGRVSAADFESCSNLYKDLAEVFSRQLTLVAGINNLLKRGDCDEFAESVKLNKKRELIKDFASLDNFTNCDLGKKLETIDDPFYITDKSAINNQLRNAIAHYKHQYTESSQLITYYPSKEGMKREKAYEITFIEFMRNLLLLFREVHSLNHIIKSTMYYNIFILKRDE